MAAASEQYELVVSSSEGESESEEEFTSLKVERKSSRSEMEERQRTREEIQKRSRMWQTVGSSDEEEELPARGEKSIPARDAGASQDSQSSPSSSESDDEDSQRKEKHSKGKREKKAKKDKREKKDKKKHKKKDKKHKKHKKDKKRTGANAGAVNQDEYGKYGIIQLADKFREAREFKAWLDEVKNAGAVLDTASQREVTEYFKEYIEDYNTATLPHMKYYNYDAWEEDEYARKKMKEAKKRRRTRTEFNDEDEVAANRKLQRQQKADAMLQETLQAMDREKIDEMRHQKMLRAELQAAYKRGDMDRVRDLEKRLDATIDDPRWA